MDSIISTLSQTYLFSGIETKDIEKINYEIKSFSKGEVIPYSSEKKALIGILLKGEAKVYTENDSSKTIINILFPKSIFGVSALFSEGTSVTKIIASKVTDICYIQENEFEKIISNIKIRNNLISFLTSKIRFLNGKIRTFSQIGNEKKLAYFLLENEDSDKVMLSGSLTDTAKSLGMGRASLYRILELLENKKIITRKSKIITICDKKALFEISDKSEEI